MSVQNPDRQATKQDLKDFYDKIAPYLGGGGSGETYTAGDGIDISQENEISVKSMESGDMAEIVTPLPSTRRGYQKYSTDEQVIGEWIDGKPLYQKTIVGIMPTVETDGTYVSNYLNHGISNIGIKIIDSAFCVDADNVTRPLFYALNAGYHAKVSITSTSLQIVSGVVSFSKCPLYVTIQYTKTTD